MKVTETALPGVILIEPRVFEDVRGYFMETFSEARYAAAGVAGPFVQDNVSRSKRGTIRGLHFQEPEAQGKLVQVLRGSVFDVVVDIRRGSPHFGKWIGVELTDAPARQLWIPPGFAHGFCATSDVCDLAYKCTRPYSPTNERTILWNDPDLGIAWPLDTAPTVSAKDAAAPRLSDAPALPYF